MALTVYLDASLLVALFTNEVFSDRASGFLASTVAPIVVSDLASAEFASVIARLVRTRDLTADDARNAFGTFDQWRERSARTAETQSQDFKLATSYMRQLRFSLRTPDAIHVALAMRLDATLVTFDRRLERDARALGVQVAEL